MTKNRYDIGDPKARRQLMQQLEKIKTRLTIARVPEKLKEEFIKEAKEKYSEDYGVLLHRLWDNSHEYDKIKKLLLNSSLKIKIEKDKIIIQKV
ncbi:MAG: hypothetical protein DRO76_03520 [Candidatus Altiarchaeales archaeon]|nr:MAG: hypothetical protein DRO76_03520 [Candidatus Altiarchaeales archaeon]